MTGSGRRSGTQAVEQAQALRGAELSEHAHREIGLWLAAVPPEQRNIQRFLAEVARTHGLAGRRGDRGWDVQATEQAFGRVAEQEWWRKLGPEALRAPEQAKEYPLLQGALQRQGYGQGPRPAPEHSMSQVMSAQQVGPVEAVGPRTTAAETAAQEAHLQRVAQSGGWGDGSDGGQQGKAPLTAEEWLHTQMPTDSARNWLMAPAQRNRYLRSSHSYWEQRASHPEWAAFDPAPRSEGAGRQELPPGQNWFSWQVHGRPDLSPIAEPRDTSPVVSEAEFRRALPGFSFIRDERPDGYGRYWGTVGAEWRREYFVNVPNRWGIQDPNGGVPATLRCNRVVAPHLVAALDELDRKGLLYLVKTIESYAPRYQLGNKVLSSHAFCVSFDMNRKEYPQLPRARRDELVAKGLPLPQQDWRLISVMQKHGFTYGGYWKGGHYDPMHFEFSDREALGL
jgi:hypothetical protein